MFFSLVMYLHCSLNQEAGYPSCVSLNVCRLVFSQLGVLEESELWPSADAMQLHRTNLLLLLRPTCGTTTKRWWRGWRGSWLKRRAPGPSSTRTSSTSAEITSSSRSAGTFSQHSLLEPSSLSAQKTTHTECFFLILFLSAVSTAASSRPIRRWQWIPSCT